MTTKVADPKYNDAGLIPAIIQDTATGDVLMMGWMNEESLKRTLDERLTWFYSRSRQELWNKGATSGNFQHVDEILLDCDQDTVLVKVHTDGPACHTGERSCFHVNV